MNREELERIIRRQVAITELEDKLETKGVTCLSAASTIAKLMSHGLTTQQISITLNTSPAITHRHVQALRYLKESEFNLLKSITGGTY